MAPTAVMPEIALVADMRGECNAGGTPRTACVGMRHMHGGRWACVCMGGRGNASGARAASGVESSRK